MFSSIYFDNTQRIKKTNHQSSVPDEEEGSYLRAGASTASSIRSRFTRTNDNASDSAKTMKRTNYPKLPYNIARRSRGTKPATEDDVESKRSKSIINTDERRNYERTESTVRKERYEPDRYHKTLDQTKLSRGQSLSKYLHNTLGHDAATTASCNTALSNGGISMVEVDLSN